MTANKERIRAVRELLQRRGYNFSRLAAQAGVGRAQLSQVLHGSRSGRETRRRVANLLEASELAVLGWAPVEPEYSI